MAADKCLLAGARGTQREQVVAVALDTDAEIYRVHGTFLADEPGQVRYIRGGLELKSSRVAASIECGGFKFFCWHSRVSLLCCEGHLPPDTGTAPSIVTIAATGPRSIDLYHPCPFYPPVRWPGPRKKIFTEINPVVAAAAFTGL